MTNILVKINCHTLELQSNNLVLQSAIYLVKSTRKDLIDMKTTEKWIPIQEKCADIAQKNGIHSTNVRKHLSI